MPILKIKTVHDQEKHTCFDDVIASCLNYLGYDYEMAFLKSWRFEYRPLNLNKEFPIGMSAFSLFHEPLKYDMVEKYHGVTINRHDEEESENYIALIKQEINNDRPCIISYNSNGSIPDCRKSLVPWYHCFIVEGYDDESGCLILNDPYNGKTGIKLKYEKLRPGALSYILTFKVGDKRPIINVQDGIGDALKGINHNNGLEKMIEFIEDINKYINIDKEFTGEPLWEKPLSWSMINYTRERYQFCVALKYLADKTNNTELMELATRFEHAQLKWKQCRIALYEEYKEHKSKDFKEQITKKYRDILQEEINLKDGLIKLYNMNKSA